jgi:ABC-type multidrug transport system ATPase subunit
MVRILATLIRADAGRARVAGFEVVADRRQVRRRISLTGQFAAVDNLQTGEENLRMLGRLAGQIALLDGGRVVAKGSPAQLKQRVAGHRLDLVLADAQAFAEADRRLGGRVVQRDPARLTVAVATDGDAAEVRALLDEVDPTRRAGATFAVRSASLDDVFLA